MVNTTYGSYIKPDTAGWTSKSQYQTAFESATGWTDTIFLGYPYLSGKAWELSGSYYVPSTSISGSQGDSIPSPSYGSAVNRNNLFVVASMFQISGLDTSADYSISTQNYISSIGLSNVTYNSPHVYLIDATNNEVVKTQTASSMLGTTVYISATYRPKTTTTVFLVCYAWESIRQTYSGSTQYPKPVLSSGYPKVGVRKLSYTYNYNKVFTLSLDAYKFDPELPVEVQMFATEGNESYGVPIARYKVNENNVVYDLQLVT